MCIEEAIIGRTLSYIDSKNGLHIHYYNEKDHAFDYQLYPLGAEKLFPNSD